MAELRHNDLIARLEINVLLPVFAGNYLFVVKSQTLGAAKDNNPFLIGELSETAGVHRRIKHRGRRYKRISPRLQNLSLDVVFLAVYRRNGDGDFRFVQ